ncbi:Hypothetical protein A7982_05396 [Minicystis rosea]|nr:Hypothetical protein A7982_05396 [Minicystis rosea]
MVGDLERDPFAFCVSASSCLDVEIRIFEQPPHARCALDS